MSKSTVHVVYRDPSGTGQRFDIYHDVTWVNFELEGSWVYIKHGEGSARYPTNIVMKITETEEKAEQDGN